jgi:hypothetical protein
MPFHIMHLNMHAMYVEKLLDGKPPSIDIQGMFVNRVVFCREIGSYNML